MWTRKLDHGIFVKEEEKYVWADTRSKLVWKLVVTVSLAVMAGVIVSAAL